MRNKKLKRPFGIVEIQRVRTPDGFNLKFIKESWGVLKDDIFNFLKDFHESSTFARGTNASSIALIPKVEEPQGWEEGDYRLILLVGWMCKVVAKILAKRLQKVLYGVIDERQSVFVEGRNILHSILIANEVVDEAWRKKKSVCFLS